MLEEINRIHMQARKIHEGATGFIRICYPGSIAYSFMPKLITSVSESLPVLKIKLVEPNDIHLEQLLLNYHIDMAFRRDSAENPALHSSCLYSEPFALAFPMNHYLNEQNFTGLQDIKDEKFILSNLGQAVLISARERDC